MRHSFLSLASEFACAFDRAFLRQRRSLAGNRVAIVGGKRQCVAIVTDRGPVEIFRFGNLTQGDIGISVTRIDRQRADIEIICLVCPARDECGVAGLGKRRSNPA